MVGKQVGMHQVGVSQVSGVVMGSVFGLETVLGLISFGSFVLFVLLLLLLSVVVG